jgi:TRAP-type transport system periplasmic protein
MKQLISATIGAITIFSAAASAAPVTLKLSNFVGPVSPMQADFIVPWTKNIEKCTNGNVKFSLSLRGSQLGNIARQHEQVVSGVVDVAHGLHGIPRGRFPRSSLLDVPFTAKTSYSASSGLWGIYEKYLKPEYKGMKLLAVHAHSPGHIHTVKKKVEKLEDMAGLRVRAPSAATSMMIKTLGGIPVGLPGSKAYENLQKGVIDGTVFPWEGISNYKLDEVLGYHLDAGLYTVSFWFAMNQKKFDSFPKEIRNCIDKYSGAPLVAQVGKSWSDWDKAGIDRIAAKGSPVTKLVGAERERWKKALLPMREQYIASVEKQGVKNAQEIYKALLASVAKFEK